MATFIGNAAANTITPAFVSAGVGRFPAGSFPSALADVIFGGGGNDTMDGGGGNDTIVGDIGNDLLRGNTGADVLIGGTGIDTDGAAAAGTDHYKLPPVFPVLNLIAGVQFKPFDKMTVNLEGGIRTFLFFGVSSSYFF